MLYMSWEIYFLICLETKGKGAWRRALGPGGDRGCGGKPISLFARIV